jgi:hypothetical protein
MDTLTGYRCSIVQTEWCEKGLGMGISRKRKPLETVYFRAFNCGLGNGAA